MEEIAGLIQRGPDVLRAKTRAFQVGHASVDPRGVGTAPICETRIAAAAVDGSRWSFVALEVHVEST
jgi:hypothetical protein